MATDSDRRFHVRTFGCQMNVHDSEKISNVLLHAGHRVTGDLEDADLLIINTCSIREREQKRLNGDLFTLRDW